MSLCDRLITMDFSLGLFIGFFIDHALSIVWLVVRILIMDWQERRFFANQTEDTAVWK